MGNCLNMEQGQHGLPYRGRMTFHALPVISENTGITPRESLCLLATCGISVLNNVMGSCSGEACVSPSVRLALIVLLPL